MMDVSTICLSVRGVMVERAGHSVPPANPPTVVASEAASRKERPGGRLRALAMGMGSAALLLAMATDALSVAGRHFGFTILGGIEIFEACIVVAATAAIVLATLDAGHARVRIVLERLDLHAVNWLERSSDALAALIFVALAAGSAWLAADLWNGRELTEVLGLPLRWLRLVWIVGSLACAAIFLRRAVERRA